MTVWGVWAWDWLVRLRPASNTRRDAMANLQKAIKLLSCAPPVRAGVNVGLTVNTL